MTESEHLFIELEPPAGGLQRLQRHVAASRPPRHRRKLQLAGAFAVTAVLVGCLWLPAIVTQQRQNTELVQALHQATAPPAGGIHVIDGGALELSSGQSDVRIYLVQSAGPAAHAGSH